MPSPFRPLSRRTALSLGVAGLAAGALAGCADGERDTPEEAAASGAGDDSDAALVEQVIAQITATAGVASAVPGLVTLHDAHLAALEATASPSAPAAPSPIRDVVRAETRLQRQLAAAAQRAESGALARLLASMSAAVSQQLARIDAPGGAR